MRDISAQPPTVDRLGVDISRGKSGDKVDFPDPAAAPLGTDAEAAGTPPTREERQMETDARPTTKPKREPIAGASMFFGLVILIIAIVIATAAFY